MVSWDLKVKFYGHTPHIKELVKLARKEGFSNIESMKQKKINNDDTSIWYLIVNNRGSEQTKFIGEKIK